VTEREVLKALKAMGTAQNRKVYARHGIDMEMYGVSYTNLTKLKKKIKRDHEIALSLWGSGNFDARVLATMIADPSRLKSTELEAWSRDLTNHGLMDAFAALVKQTPHVLKKMEKWTKSKNEFVGACGWQLLSHLAQQDDNLPDAFFKEYLEIIERDIHSSKNRTRYSMNSALIGIGIRNSRLEKKATAAAKRIGKVEVDHGETSCKTPDAVAYIEKAVTYERVKAAKNAAKSVVKKA
jgi:3-methyladenine DNA glycosylase AlkD